MAQLCLFLCALVSTTPAFPDEADSESVSVGVFLPSIFFVGSAEKADFLSQLEANLSDSLGRRVIAAFNAKPSGMAKDPLWLVDGVEAANQENLSLVLRAYGKGQTEVPATLYARKDWANAFSLLTSGRVAIPAMAGKESDLLRYWLLLDEPKADQIARRVSIARDARSALTAVGAGELEGAVVLGADYKTLEPRLAALVKVVQLGELPLPVLAINKAVVDGPTAAEWSGRLAKAKLPLVRGVIDEWKLSRQDSVLMELRQALRRREPMVSRSFVAAPLPPFQVFLDGMLPPPPEATPLNPTLVMPERRFNSLPDPPTDSETKPSVPVAVYRP
ncbi:MAG: hypothetical protein A2289_02790 [Deltaproteobacteria bacterium RIFOXYA12_FULL_58_15]|nr:MAG: hypothetical protein A2289_02790 [Deltaproteobacteria bacterium RIFOXYA12_FULL_58_15]